MCELVGNLPMNPSSKELTKIVARKLVTFSIRFEQI